MTKKYRISAACRDFRVEQVSKSRHENLQNEKYLFKQLSLSMFFYCADRKCETYLREYYPDIPYLRSLQGSEETVEAAMRSAVEEVLAECHLQ